MTERSNAVIVWIASMAAIAAVTAAGWWMGLNASTVGFLYLIAVLLVSLWGGLLVGTISSIVATLCYNFFFFRPLYTLTIAEPSSNATALSIANSSAVEPSSGGTVNVVFTVTRTGGSPR